MTTTSRYASEPMAAGAIGIRAVRGRSEIRATRGLLAALADPRRRTVALGWLGVRSSVLTDPRLNVLGVPDLAHAQFVGRLGKGWVGHDLLDPLPTQPAESFADLGGAHEVMHGGQHMHKTSGHLTSGQESARISHVTSIGYVMEKPRSGRWWQRDTPPDVTQYNHWSCFAHKSYWLTCSQYDALLKRGNGRCEICYRHHVENHCSVPHIDHDHNWGRWAVRGLLCARCNIALDYPVMGKHRDLYLAGSWYLAELDRLYIPLAIPDEPPIGAMVVDLADRYRIRRADGWYGNGGNRWHNRSEPWAWHEWVSEVGPHNLRVVRGGA